MADYKVRLVAGRYCLAETKNNWIVGCGYNPDRPEGQQWEQGKYFSKANGLTGLLSLHEATEYMYSRLDENYIPRERLIELATRFKDCANGDEDLEYVKDDMTDNELEFFELDEETEDEDMEIDDKENELKEILKENPDIEDVNWDEIWGGDDDL